MGWGASFISVLEAAVDRLTRANKLPPKDFWQLVREDLEASRQRELQSAAIKAAFPDGGKRAATAYREYKNASQFRVKMRRAGELLQIIRGLDETGVFRDFSHFMDELQRELEVEVRQRAQVKRKSGDVQSDLSSIPVGLGLDDLYKEQQAQA